MVKKKFTLLLTSEGSKPTNFEFCVQNQKHKAFIPNSTLETFFKTPKPSAHAHHPFPQQFHVEHGRHPPFSRQCRFEVEESNIGDLARVLHQIIRSLQDNDILLRIEKASFQREFERGV